MKYEPSTTIIVPLTYTLPLLKVFDVFEPLATAWAVKWDAIMSGYETGRSYILHADPFNVGEIIV